MDTKQDTPREVFFDCKYLSLPGDGMVQVKALFVDQGKDGYECTGLYAGQMHLGTWLIDEDLNSVEMEARDALYAEDKAETYAHAETRAECRRDDARADCFVPFRGLSYQSLPTAEQMAAVDETMEAA